MWRAVCRAVEYGVLVESWYEKESATTRSELWLTRKPWARLLARAGGGGGRPRPAKYFFSFLVPVENEADQNPVASVTNLSLNSAVDAHSREHSRLAAPAGEGSRAPVLPPRRGFATVPRTKASATGGPRTICGRGRQYAGVSLHLLKPSAVCLIFTRCTHQAPGLVLRGPHRPCGSGPHG